MSATRIYHSKSDKYFGYEIVVLRDGHSYSLTRRKPEDDSRYWQVKKAPLTDYPGRMELLPNGTFPDMVCVVTAVERCGKWRWTVLSVAAKVIFTELLDHSSVAVDAWYYVIETAPRQKPQTMSGLTPSQHYKKMLELLFASSGYCPALFEVAHEKPVDDEGSGEDPESDAQDSPQKETPARVPQDWESSAVYPKWPTAVS